jgi:predicted nucleotidyltransferase
VDLIRLGELLKERLVAALGDNLLAIVIFGSLARGSARFPESDVDLLLVTERPLKGFRGDLLKVSHALDEVFKELGLYPRPDVDLHTLTLPSLKRHPPILLDMVVDSLVVYDPKGVFRQELNRLEARMRELGSRRVELPDGSWYWVLKPGLKPGERVEL